MIIRPSVKRKNIKLYQLKVGVVVALLVVYRSNRNKSNQIIIKYKTQSKTIKKANLAF